MVLNEVILYYFHLTSYQFQNHAYVHVQQDYFLRPANNWTSSAEK